MRSETSFETAAMRPPQDEGWTMEAMMIHQLRIYEIFERNKAAFHARFRDHAAPIMARHGFRIMAMWETASAGRIEFAYILARQRDEDAGLDELHGRSRMDRNQARDLAAAWQPRRCNRGSHHEADRLLAKARLTARRLRRFKQLMTSLMALQQSYYAPSS